MTKKIKQDERDKIFDRFMEENFPFIYKLNKLGYEMKTKGGSRDAKENNYRVPDYRRI